MESPLRELIASKIGRDPAEWVRAEQAARRVSYERLAAELYAAHQIVVSGNTLRRWATEATGEESLDD